MIAVTAELMRAVGWEAPTEEVTENKVNHTPRKQSPRRMPATRKPHAENGVFTAQSYFSAKAQQAESLTEISRSDPMKNGWAKLLPVARLSDIVFTGGSFSNTLPAQSVTLFVLPAGTPPQLRASGLSSSNTLNGWLDGRAGERYAILGSSNFADWTPVQTNMLAGSSVPIALPAHERMAFLPRAMVAVASARCPLF